MYCTIMKKLTILTKNRKQKCCLFIVYFNLELTQCHLSVIAVFQWNENVQIQGSWENGTLEVREIH